MAYPTTISELPYKMFGERLGQKAVKRRIPVNGTIELTYRCNLNCVHCYCNLAVNDTTAREQELSTQEIFDVIDQIAEKGCLWLLFTGGECLLRNDFFDIWTYAKKKGLLVTLFTNGTLMTPEIADFLVEWPPFSVEITLYGRTRGTFESITRTPGSFSACLKGIELIVEKNIPLKLKTMVLTLNAHELSDMMSYAKGLGVEFRFDPMVNSRLDGGKGPCRFRLDPKEVARLNTEDQDRLREWKEFCRRFLTKGKVKDLFVCGAGVTRFHVTPYGKLQICMMVTEPCSDLRKGPFSDGWDGLFPEIIQQKPTDGYACGECELYPLCSQCPGWAQMETNNPVLPVEYLCKTTQELAAALGIEGRVAQ